jgi:hypothetical protein
VFRTIVTALLIFAVAVGPAWCCCGRTVADPAEGPPAAAGAQTAEPGCCCGQEEAPADPHRPDRPCPCRERSHSSAVLSGAAPRATAESAPWPPVDAVGVAPAVAIAPTAAFGLPSDGAILGPALSGADLLRALCVLRC